VPSDTSAPVAGRVAPSRDSGSCEASRATACAGTTSGGAIWWPQPPVATGLTDLDPYDVDVHRGLLVLHLRRGRYSEALRCYEALRRRLLTTFGEEFDFALTDLAIIRPKPT
jgi:Bacterial transcriptional activator domain